ncbi:Putative membrane spanning protein (plasmid) [Borrelia crocidurae DOU]|uniref:Putative membrane spanning protein n=1 Tax=Borrelia crocidurae DOU TaxID=1293575 RepID=W5SKP9_9SPIR|nr:virulence associated lipoprotein [Borrelia crocidurae]AHH07445.1 Putative membrane spanning protein [Borrelia crocidurae DOU]
MQQKVFLFMLMSLLLITCGPNEKTLVDNEEAQRMQEIALRKRRLEQKEEKKKKQLKQEEIEFIQDIIPSAVIEALSKHNDSNWNDDIKYFSAYFVGLNVVFRNVPYNVVGKDEFLYGVIGDNRGADVAERKAARREVYLALGYFNGLIRVFGAFALRLVRTPELVEEHKKTLKDFLRKIRKCAKAYYLDVYDDLQKKLNQLETLSLKDILLLRTRLEKLDAAKRAFIVDIVRPIQVRFSITVAMSKADIKNNKTTADEMVEYWETKLSSKFDGRCNDIMRLAFAIKGILDKIKVGS